MPYYGARAYEKILNPLVTLKKLVTFQVTGGEQGWGSPGEDVGAA